MWARMITPGEASRSTGSDGTVNEVMVVVAAARPAEGLTVPARSRPAEAAASTFQVRMAVSMRVARRTAGGYGQGLTAGGASLSVRSVAGSHSTKVLPWPSSENAAT